MSDAKIRIHRDTKYILDRYAKIHCLRTMHLLDKIALIIKHCLDGIDDPNWTIDDLQKHYSNSGLMCAQDVRKFILQEGDKDE